MLEIEFRETRVAGGATNLGSTSRERDRLESGARLQSRQTSFIEKMREKGRRRVPPSLPPNCPKDRLTRDTEHISQCERDRQKTGRGVASRDGDPLMHSPAGAR